jgi:hypothetical protein
MELGYAPRRVSCPRCQGIHVESMPRVSGKQRMTRALMVTLAAWTRVLPCKQVARLFQCAWATVAMAVEEAVAFGLANLDLDTKRLIWSGERRAARRGDPEGVLRLPWC